MSDGFDDALAQVRQAKREREEAIEALKQQAASDFQRELDKWVDQAVKERLNLRATAGFPAGSDPMLSKPLLGATFQCGELQYKLRTYNTGTFGGAWAVVTNPDGSYWSDGWEITGRGMFKHHVEPKDLQATLLSLYDEYLTKQEQAGDASSDKERPFGFVPSKKKDME